MLRNLIRAGLILTAISALRATAWSDADNWYKGNLHTHTVNSDGDSTPSAVATWYREHGYQFLVLSDHNYVTEVEGLNTVYGERERFLLVPGEEVSAYFGKQDVKVLHMNAYNPAGVIEPVEGATVSEMIQNNVKAILAHKGLPSFNHPNFHWPMTAQDLIAVDGLALIEVYNGNGPAIANRGGGGWPSTEELWDALLSAGKRVFGIAVDDAHQFKTFGRDLANPGRGWVVVRAPALTTQNVIAALAAGDFYASTGVTLQEVQVSASEYSIRIRLDRDARDARQTTYFIGSGGEVLAKTFDNPAVYRFRGTERYVRARVDSSTGYTAWTQPVFVARN